MEWFIRPLVCKPLTITIYAPVSGTIDHVSNIKRYNLNKLQFVVGVKNRESREWTVNKFPTINTEKTRSAHGFVYIVSLLFMWQTWSEVVPTSRKQSVEQLSRLCGGNTSSRTPPPPIIRSASAMHHAIRYTINSFQMFPAKVIRFQLAVTHLISSRVFSFQPQFDRSENDALWLVLFLPPHIRSSISNKVTYVTYISYHKITEIPIRQTTCTSFLLHKCRYSPWFWQIDKSFNKFLL